MQNLITTIHPIRSNSRLFEIEAAPTRRSRSSSCLKITALVTMLFGGIAACVQGCAANLAAIVPSPHFKGTIVPSFPQLIANNSNPSQCAPSFAEEVNLLGLGLPPAFKLFVDELFQIERMNGPKVDLLAAQDFFASSRQNLEAYTEYLPFYARLYSVPGREKYFHCIDDFLGYVTTAVLDHGKEGLLQRFEVLLQDANSRSYDRFDIYAIIRSEIASEDLVELAPLYIKLRTNVLFFHERQLRDIQTFASKFKLTDEQLYLFLRKYDFADGEKLIEAGATIPQLLSTSIPVTQDDMLMAKIFHRPDLQVNWLQNSHLPKALVVISEEMKILHDFRAAYLPLLFELQQSYNIQIRHAGTVRRLWNAIEKGIQEGPPEVVIINAHGNHALLSTSGSGFENLDNRHSSWDSRGAMLRALPTGSSIVLCSCRTGVGRETALNIANVFANYAPHSKIFAPTDITSNLAFRITGLSPFHVKFYASLSPSSGIRFFNILNARLLYQLHKQLGDSQLLLPLYGIRKVLESSTRVLDTLWPFDDSTYVIDPSRRDAHCLTTPNALNFCNQTDSTYSIPTKGSEGFLEWLRIYFSQIVSTMGCIYVMTEPVFSDRFLSVVEKISTTISYVLFPPRPRSIVYDYDFSDDEKENNHLPVTGFRTLPSTAKIDIDATIALLENPPLLTRVRRLMTCARR